MVRLGSALQSQELLIRRGDVGLVRIGDDWTTCVRVPAGRTFEDHRREQAAGRGRDPRVLGDFRDGSGRRYLGYGSALERLSQEELPGFPLRGPRAAKSFMVSLRSSNQDFTAHHEFFLRKSGLAEKSAVAREHRHMHEACRLALEYDQYDLSNSASYEYLIRRIVQVEAAVKRNPRQPDFDGLESVMDSAIDEAGAAVVADFSKWVSDRQQAEAQILKAGRMWRQERATDVKRRGGGQSSSAGAAG